MNPPPIMEQCLAALTEILNRQNQQPSLRRRIEKDLRYLPTFEGNPGTLPAFLTSVDRALADYGDQAPQAYTIVYNEKILGHAKNYLETSPPTSWMDCKAKLKLQYKLSKDQAYIMQEINLLKVSSIIELMEKIRVTVNDIAECAIFSDFKNEIVNNLSSMLVLKIKEITAGALAAELSDKFSVEEIRTVINKYIGQDQFNLKWYKYNHGIKDRHPNHNNFRNNSNRNSAQLRKNNYNFNNSGRVRQNTFNSNIGQVRHNNFNSSGQWRNNNYNNNSGQSRLNHPINNNGNRHFNNYSPNRNNNSSQVQPMEVDTLSTTNEVNQLGENEFFIN